MIPVIPTKLRLQAHGYVHAHSAKDSQKRRAHTSPALAPLLPSSLNPGTFTVGDRTGKRHETLNHIRKRRWSCQACTCTYTCIYSPILWDLKKHGEVSARHDRGRDPLVSTVLWYHSERKLIQKETHMFPVITLHRFEPFPQQKHVIRYSMCTNAPSCTFSLQSCFS